MNVSRKARLFAASLAFGVLDGCGGGGGGDLSSCVAVRGDENCADAAGCTNPQNAVDGDLTTFTQLSTLAGAFQNASRGAGDMFAAGSNAGVFVTLPPGFTTSDVTVSTVVGTGLTPVESATGPTLTITPTDGDPATAYVGFKTTAPFNGVQLTLNTTNAADTLVFEYCGSAVVH